ncbi:hypothetical protein CGH82_23305 [Vibrio parahaemolyticus]|nr:hypothetical protein CGH82_23305 [Vibrio parahaemolyticus]
MESFNGKFKEE